MITQSSPAFSQAAKTNGTSILNEIYSRLSAQLEDMHKSLTRLETSGHKLSDTNQPPQENKGESKPTMPPGFLHDFNSALELLQSLNNRAATLASKMEDIL